MGELRGGILNYESPSDTERDNLWTPDESGKTSTGVGNWIDVSDRKDLKIILDADDSPQGGFHYSWGWNTNSFPNDHQRFWLEDKSGNIIWEISEFSTYLRENGTTISCDNYIEWPREEYNSSDDYIHAIDAGWNKAIQDAKSATPSCYVVTGSGWAFQYDEFDMSTGEMVTGIWEGTDSRCFVYTEFDVELPEDVTEVRLHYEIALNWGDADYNAEDDPNDELTPTAWCSVHFRDIQWKKKICEYSHEPGGSMGENLGAYGGTSSAYSGVYVSSSSGSNSGNGSVKVDELPLNIIVRYASGDSDSGRMDDTSVNGLLSETNVTLSPNQYAKRGYTFMGWSLESGGTVAVGDGASINISKSPYSGYLDHSEYGKVILTLYPVFEVNSYKLYFSMPEPRNSDGDSVADRVVSAFDGFDYDTSRGMYYKEVTCFEPIGSLPNLSMVGWDFDGWYLESKRKITSTDVWVWESNLEVTP